MAKTETLKLDKDNIQFNNATEFIQQTNELLYLTGKAGTGKTTFLKHIKKITEKNTVILAPTGVAAINAGGVTIHSFFQIPFSPFLPNDLRLRTNSFNTESKETIYTTFKYQEDKKKIIENLELLIIDEISMVRCDILDIIDKILRVFRKINHLPFGGVQVILIGDTFQLPPIANGDEWSILSQFYKTPFFFSSKVIEQNKPTYIELKKIYRQNEQEFIDLLNRVRVNKVNSNDFSILNSKYNPTFSSNGSDYIILATHNRIVNQTNLTKLNQLKTKIHTFEANVNKIFPDKIMPTDRFLKLKVGAQIMFIKNDIGDNKRYYNGKIGRIKELEINKIVVVYRNKQDEEKTIIVEKAEWENIRYTYNKEKKKIEEEIIGTFEQYPIRLAWAITVHKSQGLTFEKVIADLGSSFASGQVYVALSRCTSFSGLVLKSQLHQNAIKTDLRVLEFAKNETPNTLIAEQLSTGKADFNYKKSREYFNKGKFSKAFTFFKKALKYRNDIETDTFNKFVEIQGKRLITYKSKFEKQQNCYKIIEEKLKNKENEFNDLAEGIGETINLNTQQYLNQILDLEYKISDLHINLGEKNQKITEHNSTIELLIKKTEEFESKYIRLEEKLKTTEQELKVSKTKINGLEVRLKNSQIIVEKYGRKNESYKREVERIKELKWYDKLLGKQ
ncbi:AAA family ATPase [Tenacibaculum dicentrarchi]|uniref:ATP-dependent DNA helicase n=1 Tax=Tenacibaculum finnmarkense TaxID=2781243 RepID=UPI001E466949|nr:DEAD/DEAH box helicase [Tenacibaculum finnmarkense]MCD8443179.1 AAA family ATPase [Tenacibaculum dicentrarchi]WCC46265.1 AAA family ATPase [Tenacibaculum finnmarkense]